MNTVITIGAGLPAAAIGGWISDKYEPKINSIKSIVAGGGALAAVPFIFIAYILQPSFWISIWSYYIAYLLAEMWYGPAHA